MIALGDEMVSCKEFASVEKERIKELIEAGDDKYRLDIFQVGDVAESNAYIKGKMKDCEEVGIDAVLHKFGEDISAADLAKEVSKASFTTSGVIIQLPVPKQIDAKLIAKCCCFESDDVDGMAHDKYIPCTARGVIDWLSYNKVDLDGKNVVVIGRSDIVGKPMAKEMTNRNATVTLCHSHTDPEYIRSLCRTADIVVVAVGKPEWFDMECPNAIIVDVGINRVNGRLVGDVNPETNARYITPVPGGVGLLTRVALLRNIIDG